MRYIPAFRGILLREVQKFLRQKTRFFASLVRPLVWLFIFAAGFRSILGVSIIPPYETYILYEEYISPGLVGVILLFSGMQNSLSMVYDREMGSMRVMLISPVPRWYLLLSKLFAGVIVATLQVYIFLSIAWFWEVQPPMIGYLYVLPAVMLSGLMLSALGLMLSSMIKQIENFAGIMNFIIFPMFFASSALYPLWRIKDSSEILYNICLLNPFTYAVELIRFSLYGKFSLINFLVVLFTFLVFYLISIYGYNPERGFMHKKQ